MNISNPTKSTLPPKNKIVNNIDINKILVYSASITKAKPPLAYSVLYPETNSDSPSAKSKGVRLVSAKQDTNQTNERRGMTKTNQS